MSEKLEVQMIATGEAIKAAYAEFAALGEELSTMLVRMEPRSGPDNRDSSVRLRFITRGLQDIEHPDLSALPIEVAESIVGANVDIRRTPSRQTRLSNAMAKLRPALAKVRRAGMMDLADKIERDLLRADVGPIPGAYDKSW